MLGHLSGDSPVELLVVPQIRLLSVVGEDQNFQVRCLGQVKTESRQAVPLVSVVEADLTMHSKALRKGQVKAIFSTSRVVHQTPVSADHLVGQHKIRLLGNLLGVLVQTVVQTVGFRCHVDLA